MLDSVSCVQPQTCVAVGHTPGDYLRDGTSADVAHAALIEVWNGSRWAVQSTPALPESAELLSVSCVSTLACTAVGIDAVGTLLNPMPLIEHWDGTQWSLEASAPYAPPGASLDSTSCTSATSCVAVGSISGGSTLPESTFAESWGGTSWMTAATPNPAPSPLINSLAAVSCTPPATCIAIGSGGPG